jgi:hypothetical protein
MMSGYIRVATAMEINMPDFKLKVYVAEGTRL